MEKIQERINTAQRALTKLHELAVKPDLSDVERDALIQRFEFSFELLWKCAKEYLYVVEGIDAASPKKVIRCCRELGLLDDEQTREALQMADDRNLTTHTYDETFAQAVVERIRRYAPLLQLWLGKIGGAR
ncbi:HI0074 family nucleotidyltransferase substrate-binding subunit [Acidaminococcus fermentans]|uniref:Nucleotidyltransferase substrate binding protein, HI0074 family n=1 Tax=Acidaminococcus fermentans TaxID=905 RepID=A0A1H2XMS7_ACIFE|nr:HI0074 family nucleotidyltransferase substrate-binding subunit [Acidaminococcus fermentans]MCI6286555.1 nucleotidyltransferase substrate binding protein [Acidaminococcus fermentans]MDD6287656.1 HI0074 family nucleotidyltransferase substrate-binding subunit [Acidaminococcus fermentans]MDD7196180.1 HI0074 family nucleotidyltransferase substrate-binding subunit [Acidaminococcus fermentans]MDY2852668.1 HI0074 family nucleotidyltransferase substrate-binding subunit [Acidaminococcus fermentans]SD